MYNACELDDLKGSIRLSEVIGRYVALKPSGRQLTGCCPFHEDRSPSFSVCDDKGLYHCFGCGAAGDVFTFLMQTHGVEFRDAKALLLDNVPGYAPAPPSKPPKAKPNNQLALEIWSAARSATGTPAETYLASRNIPLAAMPGPVDIRFDRLWHSKHQAKCPAMISGFRNLDGTIVGIQRTYLTSDGRKITGTDAKRSLGQIRGSAIKLGNSADKLIVCEGLEDGLSIWMEVPNSSVWVVAGAEMMAGLQLPTACHDVIIAADNDQAGRIAAERAATAFQQQGRRVSTTYPPPAFKDFNEMRVLQNV